MHPHDLQRKSPDAAGTGPGHGHQEVPPVSEDTLQAPRPTEVHPDVDAVRQMRVELGATRHEFAAEHLEDARPELREAMKELDTSEDRDLHVRLGKLLNELDDLRAVLSERWGS